MLIAIWKSYAEACDGNLNPSDFTQAEFFWTGLRDAWDTYHVVRLLRPGSAIFDVGANFGYYSIVACAELNGDCEVYAFEPNTPSFARLTQNIQLNGFEGQIRALRIALSDTSGSGWMVEHPGNSGDARVNRTCGTQPISLTYFGSVLCGKPGRAHRLCQN